MTRAQVFQLKPRSLNSVSSFTLYTLLQRCLFISVFVPRVHFCHAMQTAILYGLAEQRRTKRISY